MDVFCIDSVDIDSIECIRDPCPVSTVLTYIVLIVWLKSTQSQLNFEKLNSILYEPIWKRCRFRPDVN